MNFIKKYRWPLLLLVIFLIVIAISILMVLGCRTDKNDALFAAVKEGDLNTVKKLVAHGADINAKDKYGSTVLHNAVYHQDAWYNVSWYFPYEKASLIHHVYVSESDRLKIVKWLIEQGADVNATNELGWSVLHYAVWSEDMDTDMEMIKYLVEQGADIKAKAHDGSTVLHCAARSRNVKMVQWFVEKGLDVNAKTYDGTSVLDKAFEYVEDFEKRGDSYHYSNLMNVVVYLVEQGADVNAKRESGLTALQRAVKSGNLELAKWLVDHGADVNEPGMYFAVESGNLELVKWLIENGWDINKKDGYGLTILSSAAKGGNLRLVKWLVEKGLDVNEKNGNGWTILHSAVQSGNLELVKWLVEQGLDVNAKTIDGETVINAAASFASNTCLDNAYNYWSVVLYLLEQGADINEGLKRDLLDSASLHNHWELVKWLVVHGADVNIVYCTKRYTVLHRAAESGNLEMVEWLVEHGADVNAKIEYGDTVIEAAIRRNRNWKLVQYLVDHGAVSPSPFFWLEIWLFGGCSNISLLFSLILQSKLSMIFLGYLLFVGIGKIINSIAARKKQDLLGICNAIKSLQNNLQNSPDETVNIEMASSAELQKEQNQNANQNQFFDNSSDTPPSDVSN